MTFPNRPTPSTRVTLHPILDMKKTALRPGPWVLLGLPLLFACGQSDGPVVQPPEVTVETPIVRDVPAYGIFTGTTRATESVEVRARVSGVLERMYFEPGGLVNEGDPLFLIQPEFYEAVRDEAVASVASARAEADRAQSDLERLEQAIQTNAVSASDVDRARALRDQAVASVASAEARLVRAELDVEYTRVTSPINGAVGRNLVDLGNLVGTGEPTLLTTVNGIDPIFVYFDAPERVVLQFLAQLEGNIIVDEEGRYSSRVERPDLSEVGDEQFVGRVEVATAEDRGFPHPGYLDFIDNTVNPATGTIQMRAVLPNASYALFPGLFVRVRVFGGIREDAVVVSEAAVGRDLGGAYVFLVGDDDIVERRYVELGDVQDDGTILILDGLDGTERYITRGLLRARPGLPVTPTSGSGQGG
jgi:RND family efflux transporter MFP subunit